MMTMPRRDGGGKSYKEREREKKGRSVLPPCLPRAAEAQPQGEDASRPEHWPEKVI